MDSSTIILIDENEKEQEYKIFFTYENPDNGRKYVFYYDDSQEEEDPIYYVSRYDDEQQVFELDEEEQEMAEEVFNTFVSDEENFEIVD